MTSQQTGTDCHGRMNVRADYRLWLGQRLGSRLYREGSQTDKGQYQINTSRQLLRVKNQALLVTPKAVTQIIITSLQWMAEWLSTLLSNIIVICPADIHRAGQVTQSIGTANHPVNAPALNH